MNIVIVCPMNNSISDVPEIFHIVFFYWSSDDDEKILIIIIQKILQFSTILIIDVFAQWGCETSSFSPV